MTYKGITNQGDHLMIVKIDGRLKTVGSAPTYIGSAGGRKFYEHPIYGDESPMIERVGEGQYISTTFWELEDAAAALPILS